MVTMIGPVGGPIRFTRDGSAPTVDSELYTVPFVVDRTTTLRARTIGEPNADSTITAYAITIRVATPSISPPGGSFDGDTIVTLYCATPAAEIRYTLNGSNPDQSSFLYNGPFLVTSDLELKVRAFLSPKDDSLIASATFDIGQSAFVYFGYSPLDTLTENQLKAISNAPELSNNVEKSDFFGTYRIGSSSTVNDYFYFWSPATFSVPRVTDGFRDPLGLGDGAMSMAGPPQGFIAGPTNGWYYTNLTVDGIAGRLYRTYYQIGGGSSFFDVQIQ